MKKIPLLLLAGMTLLFACSKNDDDGPAPDPNKEAAEKLQKEVQGKWLFGADVVLGGRQVVPAGSKTLRSLMGRPQSQQVTPNGTNGTTGTNGVIQGFIEFAADSTFIIYDVNERVYTGKFEAKSADSIVLSGIGYLTGIKITGDKLDFKLFYNATSKTITIATNKTVAIPANDRAALMCKGPWYITKEESGADWIGQEEEGWDENGNPAPYIVDSVTFLMSPNGTYLIQVFSGDKLKEANMANWTWHPSKPDRFLYEWDNGPFDEDNDVQITELTANILKLTEGWDEDGDDVDDTFEKWVLKPVR